MRRDVLIMCVSAGKSAGEIAWRRCEGDWVWRTRCRMAGEEKFGYSLIHYICTSFVNMYVLVCLRYFGFVYMIIGSFVIFKYFFH